MLPDYECHLIQTERLNLYLVHPTHLIMLSSGKFENSLLIPLGFSNPHNVLLQGPSPVRWRAPQVQQDITLNRWFIRWVVERATREVIGSISFHAPPDENGMIEIGLGIDEHARNRGFGKEALTAMWNWVVGEPHVRTLRYTVSPDNAASVAIIQHFGFDYVGQQHDPEDGPEDIYEMSAADWVKRP